VFLGLFALLAVAAWLATRVARKLAARQAPAQAATPGRAVKPSGRAVRASGQAAPASGRAAQPATPGGGAVGWLVRALPYTTLVIAAVMPLAAGLYLLTTTAWAAAERAVLGPRVRHVRAPSRSA
jgi:YidC/Oxa1 family membrane protein insertase